MFNKFVVSFVTCGETSRLLELGGMLVRFNHVTASFVIWRRPFVEDGAHSLLVKPQPESVFLRKFGDFCLSVFLVQGPDAFEVPVVNSAMLPRFAMHLAFNLSRERFHPLSAVKTQSDLHRVLTR
jgi:hypothetical protein